MKNNLTPELNYLLSPRAVRETTQKVWNNTLEQKGYFQLHLNKLPECVDYVLKVIQENYPALDIPFHSRWGHFRAGGIKREDILQSQIKNLTALEKARTKLDLVITSVLLDAGSGPKWSYIEESTGLTIKRSEGLGVASFYLFMSGALSSESEKKFQADSEGLKNLKLDTLKKFFQVSDENPLTGSEGRLQLLKNLGEVVAQNKEIFPLKRPGSIVDYLMQKYGSIIPAEGLLQAVLMGLGPIWPGRIIKDNVNLGDVWNHSELGPIVFHKLSQWMTYSLVEPLLEAGLKIEGAEKLTGLAEYRNGGLFLDLDVIECKDADLLKQAWPPESDFIIEWRALTVQLLDLVGAEVQKKLGKSPEEFPLAKVLEGGTWWAGRKIALEKRPPQGGPPLNIISDGTVF